MTKLLLARAKANKAGSAVASCILQSRFGLCFGVQHVRGIPNRTLNPHTVASSLIETFAALRAEYTKNIKSGHDDAMMR